MEINGEEVPVVKELSEGRLDEIENYGTNSAISANLLIMLLKGRPKELNLSGAEIVLKLSNMNADLLQELRKLRKFNANA